MPSNSRFFRELAAHNEGAPYKETYAEQLKAEYNACVICGKHPTIYMVKDKGFCIKHKSEAIAARKVLSGIANAHCEDLVARYKSYWEKATSPTIPRSKGLMKRRHS